MFDLLKDTKNFPSSLNQRWAKSAKAMSENVGYEQTRKLATNIE